MDLFPLQTFVTVATAGSVNRAATDLHLSQASVSRHVQRLEHELGVALFRRSEGRALELTAAGERVLELGVRLLDDTERSWDRLRAAAHDVRPRTVVGVASLIPLIPRFATMFGSFREAHPDVDVEMVESANFATTLRDVVHGTIDVGIGGLDDQHPTSIEAVSIMPVGLRVILPKTHPLADREQLTLPDVADETFAFLEGSSALEQFTAACTVADLRPRIAHRCSQAITLAGLMASGTVATVIYSEQSRQMEGPLSEMLVSIGLDVSGPTFTFSLYWSRERQLPTAARAFVDHIRPLLEAEPIHG